jgi:hypothetical protein
MKTIERLADSTAGLIHRVLQERVDPRIQALERELAETKDRLRQIESGLIGKALQGSEPLDLPRLRLNGARNAH